MEGGMMSPRRYAVLVVAVVCLLFCFGCAEEASSPPRPDGLPDDATYAWNGYSGEWVICRVTGASAVTCDRFNPSEGEFDLRVHLQLCMNVQISNATERPPAIPIDIGDTYALFNEVRFFHARAPRYIGSSELNSDRVQAILHSSELAFQEYGVSESCEPLGRLVAEANN
jgi:hypothetical protein